MELRPSLTYIKMMCVFMDRQMAIIARLQLVMFAISLVRLRLQLVMLPFPCLAAVVAV